MPGNGWGKINYSFMETLESKKLNHDFQKIGFHEESRFWRINSLQELPEDDIIKIVGGLHPAVIVGGIILVGVWLGAAYCTREKNNFI